MNAYIVLWNVRNKTISQTTYETKCKKDEKMKRHLTIKNMKNFTHWNVLYDLVLSIHSLDSTTHNVTLMTSVDNLNPIFICMSH